MKESLWGYYLVLLGITVSVVMIMVSNMTTTNQQNYYLLKEVTNAAMIDAIDYAYYREYGSIKINTEKFVENFLRRFSEGISKTNTYKIDFYSIYENPPSVSIKVTSNTGEYNIAGDSTNIDVINTIDAIMEANNEVNISKTFFSIPWGKCEEIGYITSGVERCHLMNKKHINVEFLKEELKKQYDIGYFDSSKVEIVNSEFLYVESDPKNIPESALTYGYIVEEEKSAADPEGLVVGATGSGSSTSTGSTSEGSTSTLNDFYTYGGSNSDVKPLVADAGAIYEVGTNFFTTDVNNVNLGMVKRGNEFYVSYGLDYNCGTSKYLRWRLRNFYFKSSTGEYIDEATFNGLSEDEQGKYTNLLNEKSQPTGVDGNHWPPEVHENVYIDWDETKKNNYTKATYYGACLIGVWYKVDFKYNNAS